ncbi:MAG: YdcF family protein [Candidatus Jacksonbacteria bacterium]|jgi:uncharacterized SAM-binding protein YcdF (DUF218 family)|nr:YdcF family protein [Candidatus Jacksonbacteria bacterium]MBT6034556.1 YdcF family protein [Candidatus Jacksonbacteria bacterium]MBT6301237.1 YdcF family protein [Candidatus Jacksonbacteria bacterium]MBT6756946.1 YdcF family protein [Candidatus Jacksonbacteria bacterium]MBT6955197.1 YdcF family protein [Candidatus Jacksonbacteria bacterium]
MRYLLVPSCGIKKKNKLGPKTRARLELALRLWSTGNFDRFIVTGGIFRPKRKQTVSAGRLMASWLCSRGIQPGLILCEEESLDTYQNISGALALIASQLDYWPEITVVTNWQHLLRFRLTFLWAHGKLIRGVAMPVPSPFDPKACVLEWGMLLVHLIDRNGTGRIVARNRRNRTYPKSARTETSTSPASLG